MPTQSNLYIDLRGRQYNLDDLDTDERALLESLRDLVAGGADWYEYSNERVRRVGAFYEQRDLSRRKVVETALWRIAGDIGGRLGIEQGHLRAPDYRDELEALVRERFPTRREFCRVSGISEDMLSHVLARRKHLSVESLTEALARVGCALRIVPLELERVDD
jgi:hypothetical protein